MFMYSDITVHISQTHSDTVLLVVAKGRVGLSTNVPRPSA